MKSTATLLTVFLLSLTAFSQPAIEWQKSLGGSVNDWGYSIDQTIDGGYVVAGKTESDDGDVTNNFGFTDFWVVKLSSDGIVQWQKSLGGSSSDEAHSIQQTTDGGYIIAGYTGSSDGDVTVSLGGADFWIVKLDEMGVIEWQKSVGGSNNDIAYSIQQTIEGGYIVAGETWSNDGDVTNNNGSRDIWVVKLNTSGEIEWQKSLGGSNDERGSHIIQTIDGTFIVAGFTYSNDGDITENNGVVDGWLVKLAATGEIDWQKSIGGSAEDLLGAIQQTTEGGYVVTGHTHSDDGDVSGNHGDWDAWVVKLDNTGNLEWQNAIGGSDSDLARSIEQTIDGGYVVGGITGSSDGDISGNNGSGDYLVVKLSQNGAIEWQKSLGGVSPDDARSIQQTPDGGYIVGGISQSNDGDVAGNHGERDYWVVKLGSNLGVDENQLNNFAVLSPNPNSGKFTLSFSEEITVTSVKVINVLGKTVYSETNIPRGTFEIEQNFTAGVYFVKVYSANSATTVKMIVD